MWPLGRREYKCEDSFCLQVKIKHTQVDKQKIPRPLHLITNLAYRLKPHHTWNLYLRARHDTCADVNLMSASMYKLVFKDPNMKKLTPSNLEIGTYTTDTVTIVGSCTFYLIKPDIKKLMKVTFYVATNDGSVLLSCKTTLMLGLIQPRTRLDYLPPRASLITSTTDHPRKLKWLCISRSKRCPLKQLCKKWLLKHQKPKRSSQANNKQRQDSVWVPKCFWGNWHLPRTILSHPDQSKCGS